MASFCSYFNHAQCRSCQWIDLDYPSQILIKEERIRAELEFMAPFDLSPSVCSPTQGFRNRVKMSVTGSLEQPVIGILGKETLDHGQELLNCPIHLPQLNILMKTLPEFIRAYRLIPYQIENRSGELKGLIAFYSEDQMYLRFVLRSKECVSRIQKALPSLLAQFPELRVVSANIQPVPHAILEGPEEIILTPAHWIQHRVGTAEKSVPLKLTPQAFVQTNSTVANQLYATAADWILEIHPKKMLELFCGQGAFSFLSAPHVEKSLGIEINPDAVKIANETAAQLKLTHLNFKCADANQVENEMTSYQPDFILANPPRRGLGQGLKYILESKVRNFIYSSCSIESLASDLRAFESEYTLKKVQLFDLFPHTEHFETLIWLEKRF